MKREIKILIAVLALISGIGIAMSAVSCFLKNRVVTTTIVGSGDGPTSIFLAGKIGSSTKLYIGTILLTFLTVAFAAIMKYRSGGKKGK